MEFTTEISANGRRTRSTHVSSSSTAPPPPTYGYHNTFHTHAQLPIGPSPSYAKATDPKTLRYLQEKALTEARAASRSLPPPAYTCTVEQRGVLGVRQELSSPFQVAGNREWSDVYAIIEGTQLGIYRVKQPGLLSKSRQPSAGRLLKTYTLQHAEVGIASDFKRTALIPKSPFAHLVPASARPKLYETDPHFFEPVREHAFRLRLETEQFLLCAPTQESMLDWLEALCAAIDISPPIEDRSEIRYRSLPRRGRRQRVLDSAQYGDNLDNLSSLEAGRRIIAQQEQIIRQLYPHLAATREPGNIPVPTADLELDDFDPEDVRFPGSRSAGTESQDGEGESRVTDDSDPKNAAPIQPSASQNLRYRRRCAPVLLSSSPRVSDVVFSGGKRMRINVKEHTLVEYTSHPPRYDAHGFPKVKRASKAQNPPAAIKEEPVTAPSRPGSPIRGASDDSITSITFGEDLAPAASRSTEDVSSSSEDVSSSGPPSPTAISHVKANASRQLVDMPKPRASEDGRENTVALGVGLLV